ncbi:Rap1a/Tai family immunity protein [Achromobacter xylosoxidans]|uniref:Rap1a/Tai family immunity protein n=1 Tax=Alcaligenes xylosoxydans xylosoxydans TaxID=85698 RepID=UPI000B48CAFC|nr:Rap1a/Tai family immunity protein [Achromobacter xylosoxidans]
MRSKTVVLVLAVLAAWSQPAVSKPDYESGNWWLERCQAGDAVSQGSCVWFVYGFTQGLAAQAVGSGAQKIYCQPESVTYGQAKDIWIKYMQDNPAERHKPAGVLLMVSMLKAFPCAVTR